MIVRKNPILGLILIILGIFFLLASLHPILANVVIFAFALFVINYGLAMRNMPNLFYFIKMLWSQIKRFMK